MLRLTITLAAAVWALTIVALITVDRAPAQAPTTTQPAALDSSEADAPHVAPQPPLVGFAINIHHIYKIERYIEALDDLAALGVDAVEILTPIYQTHGASIDLHIDPDRCPTPAQLRTIIDAAHKRGLKVVLMPIVLFSEPRGNEWRGKIQPEDWDPWWQAYSEIMLTFADLARESKVEILSVGSELLSTERQTERWIQLIKQFRARFPGQLTYSTNWDHYFVSKHWPQLDRIGINGYWELTDTPDVPDRLLTERWREIRAQVTAFAAKVQRPIHFTEIGYPSLEWGLRDPWNYVGQGEPAAPEIQVRGLAAFINAWSDLLIPEIPDPQDPHPPAQSDPLAGVMFYEWDLYRNGGPNDTGYGIRGKPAFQLIHDWLEKRNAALQADTD
ncbi:MAG: hypothetical protein CMJ49_08075 [Planctomycetaceae bacterium]|nr:hypothetical protein [Planctomycetaceae bacterium]